MGRNMAMTPPRKLAVIRWIAVFLALLPLVARGAGPAVVFLGDSLTAGYTLPQSAAYPALLEQTLGITAINAGVNGNTSADGLARLDRDVLAYQPRIVVVELGINDHRRRIPAEQTLQNLEAIAQRIRQSGARLVLVHVNPVLGPDPLLRGLRDLARRHGAVLVEDLLRGIITDPDLRVDMVHPNARGHQTMAERLRPILAKLLQTR